MNPCHKEIPYQLPDPPDESLLIYDKLTIHRNRQINHTPDQIGLCIAEPLFSKCFRLIVPFQFVNGIHRKKAVGSKKCGKSNIPYQKNNISEQLIVKKRGNITMNQNKPDRCQKFHDIQYRIFCSRFFFHSFLQNCFNAAS